MGGRAHLGLTRAPACAPIRLPRSVASRRTASWPRTAEGADARGAYHAKWDAHEGVLHLPEGVRSLPPKAWWVNSSGKATCRTSLAGADPSAQISLMQKVRQQEPWRTVGEHRPDVIGGETPRDPPSELGELGYSRLSRRSPVTERWSHVQRRPGRRHPLMRERACQAVPNVGSQVPETPRHRPHGTLERGP